MIKKNKKTYVAQVLMATLLYMSVCTSLHAQRELPAFTNMGFQDLVNCQAAVPAKLENTKKAGIFFRTLSALNLDLEDKESWRKSRNFLPLAKLPAEAGVNKIIGVKRFPDNSYSKANQHIVLYQLKQPVKVLGKQTRYVMISFEQKDAFYDHLNAERYRVMALLPAASSAKKRADTAVQHAKQLSLPIIYDLPTRVLAEKAILAENISNSRLGKQRPRTRSAIAIQQQLKHYAYRHEEMRKEDELSASRFLINTYKAHKLPALNPESITQVGCTYVRAYDPFGKHSVESLGIQPADILSGLEWVK